MAKTPTALRNSVKDKYIQILSDFFAQDEEVLRTNTHEIAFPVVDEEGNELFVTVKVAVPTGSRDDKEPYDGYSVAEAYSLRIAEKAEKAKNSAEKKAAKIARDKELREKKRAEKEQNS